MFDKWFCSNFRWALAATTGLAAAGWVISLRNEAPGQAAAGPAPSRPDRQRLERAGDIRTEFVKIANEKDAARRDVRLLALAARWLDVSPEDAMRFAIGLPPGYIRNTFLRQLSVGWARTDAEAALAWSDRLDDAAVRLQVRSTVCIAVAESDPRLALGLALRHGSDAADNDSLLDNLAAQWADREPAAALDWVTTQPGGEWHDRLMARVAFVLSKSDPHAAACRVAQDMQPGPMQDEAVISVLHQWAIADVLSAARWVEAGIPDGQLRVRALAELSRDGSRIP